MPVNWDTAVPTVAKVVGATRFAELAPAEVYATLLDEGRYLCSERTMYRVLGENTEVRERRNHSGTRSTRHPSCSRPRRTSSEAGTSPRCRPQKWTYSTCT
jgi:putative transposase